MFIRGICLVVFAVAFVVIVDLVAIYVYFRAKP